MKNFPEGISFKYPWRKYQNRVLEELSQHLSNRHLHVIAPPGSGKTVLGLEVMLRLNKPVVILTPTIAIRNQWIQRFCELFLQSEVIPDWISKDIRNPKFMTVSTYQGVHAVCNNTSIAEVIEEDSDNNIEDSEDTSNKNIDAVIAGLKEQGVNTIVLDEAHHLKNEWWSTLTKIKEGIDPVIVALTATPPYDVSSAEWQRYCELNGPVDAEISVPELVSEGDLCPHQDYIYYSLPTIEEKNSIDDIKLKIQEAFDTVKHDKTLIQAIEQHPMWVNPESDVDWVYNNLECYSAMLIFLNANGKEIAPQHLDVIGNSDIKIPELDFEWMETLLEFYLFKEKAHFEIYNEHKLALKKLLRENGVLLKRRIMLQHNERTSKKLISSISKLESVKSITDFEYEQLGSDLRLVILTDYIRKEYYVESEENTLHLRKIGVIPIFEKLRRDNPKNIKIGILSGSIVIIPKSALTVLQEIAKTQYGIDEISTTAVPFDSNYLCINVISQLKNNIVQLVTDIFEEGHIEVLIGTKSLLGEGWDAPAVNALIIASFVGSFVLSNQMRGRAMRAENGNANKTGNIWHLVCIDKDDWTGGEDLQLLERRFKGFLGVSYNEEEGIENGTKRLNVPLFKFKNSYSVEKINKEILTLAANRKELKEKWDKALGKGVQMVEEIKIPFEERKDKRTYRQAKNFYYNRTIAYIIAELLYGFLAYLLQGLKGLGRARSWEQINIYLGIITIAGLAFFGSKIYKSFKLYLKYRDISKDIKAIAEVVLRSLYKEGHIETEYKRLKITTIVDETGAVFCHLDGATTYEKSIFINSLTEVISPINNPRYIIIRKSKLYFINQQDYHAVPEVIAKNKKPSEYFAEQWQTLVGNCELIFTRNPEGRKLLLESKVKALANQLDDNKIETVSKWR